MPAVSIIRHPRRISGPCDECAGRRRGLSVAPDPRDRSFGTRRAARRRRATRGRGLGRELGTPVVVENRSGRVNVTESYLAGEADGYTILVATTETLTIIPAAR